MTDDVKALLEDLRGFGIPPATWDRLLAALASVPASLPAPREKTET